MLDLTRETFKNIIYMARRFKLATVLNMLGLIVAFTAFYVFLTQIIYQASFNGDIPDHERLYRMESDFVYNEWEFSDIVSRPFADALKRLPEVESYSLVDNVNSYPQLFKKPGNGQDVHYTFTLANETAVSILSGSALDGKIEWNGDNGNRGIIIPESVARDYFGTVQATGKEMVGIFGDATFTRKVMGVYKDFPANSDIPNAIFSWMEPEDTLSLDVSYSCIVKFKADALPVDTAAFTKRYKQALIDYLTAGMKKEGKEEFIDINVDEIRLTSFKFTPLGESYFEHTSFTPGKSGYRVMFYLLEIFCALVLALAAINFLNFTLAESPMRVRGLNTRLVMGASLRSVRLGLIGEGVITAIVACLLSLVLCSLLQSSSFLTGLTDGNLSLQDHLWLVLSMLAIAIVIGIAASAYPAAFATSFPMSISLKGNFGLTPVGRRLRQALVGLQLCISALMIIYIGILYCQARYIYNLPYGYDKENLLIANLPKNLFDYTPENDTLRQQLAAMPGIEKIMFADEQLGQTDGHSTVWTSHNGEVFKYSIMHVSPDYPTTMKIELIEGRSFNNGDTAAIIVNRAAQERWPWIQLESVIGTNTSDTEPDSAVVVGICENIRYGTIRAHKNLPFLIVYDKNYPYLSAVSMRVAADADRDNVMRQVNNLLRDRYGILSQPAVYFNNQLEVTYGKEFRYMYQMVLLAITCLILTLIGVFCITIFETEFRRKEIGIRKVSGATTGRIIMVFCRRYTRLLLISFAVAAPIALISGWLTLRTFAEHAGAADYWWVFPLSLVLVSAITLGIVAARSWRAASENPINSIRTE